MGLVTLVHILEPEILHFSMLKASNVLTSVFIGDEVHAHLTR